MYDTALWKVLIDEVAKPAPVHSVPLTPSPERTKPVAGHLGFERVDTVDVARNGVVVHVALDHCSKPFSNLINRVVKLGPQKLLYFSELVAQPLGHGLSPDDKALHGVGRSTHIGKTEKIKRFRLTQPSPLPVFDSESPELNKPGLLRVKRQTKFSHPCFEVPEKPSRPSLMLKAKDKVSSPGESHPQALLEPDLNLSTHPAPIIQPQAKSLSASGQKVGAHVSRFFPTNALPCADGDSAFYISSEPTEPALDSYAA